ncbi:MAG: hypothetical protein HEQ40_02820 [Lacibacter sp.]|jgi:hypothetical protein
MKTFSTISSLFEKWIPAFALLLLVASCTKKTETLDTLTLEELMPVKKGKFITYRVDSLIFFNGGKAEKINSYQVRHQFDSLGVDNLNRPMWIVNTYINDSSASGSWTPNGQYTVTFVDNKRAEVNENNLRVIKLYLPVKESFTWLGNSYLPDKPYASYGTNLNISLWNFSYDAINQTERIGNQTINDVTTVLHINESRGVPLVDNTKYASQERSLEKYAKNIGMVYREHYVWENQPNERTSGTPPVTTFDPRLVGFGIKMWMVARN